MGVELRYIPTAKQTIAVLEYAPRRARGVSIVAGHGYSSSKHNLDFLCGFLSAHGYRILSLDFPGHKLGASGGRLDRFDDAIAAMAGIVDHTIAAYEGPVYVMGHSMGAMTALRVASIDRRVAGAISIATGYGRNQAVEKLASMGGVDLRSSYVDGLALPQLTAEAAVGFDAALAGLAGRPLLVVGAERDMMVGRTSINELFERAPEPKSLRMIASDHTYAAENAKADVLAWLNELHPRGE